MVGRNCGQVNRSTPEEAPPNLTRMCTKLEREFRQRSVR